MATVATGAAVAQVIALGFAPIITRLYAPEAFGALGVFMAIAGIISVIATLNYAKAIVLPRDDKDAAGLMWLSGIISLGISLFVAMLLFGFRGLLKNFMGIDSIESFLIFIPMAIFFAGCSNIFQQWMIRKKQFKPTAKIDVAESLAKNGTKTGFGLLAPTAFTLIIVTTLGDAFKAFLLFTSARKLTGLSDFSLKNPKVFKKDHLKLLAKRYRDFPMYRAPQNIIFAISQSLPVLLLASLFGVAAAGFYTLGRKILKIPASLISKSIANVIYPKLAESINQGNSIFDILKQSTLWLFALGILPTIAIMVFGPKLFGLIFGNEWIMAGHYARWLSLMVLFMVVNKPCVVATSVLGLQGFLLIYEAGAVLLRALGLVIGFIVFHDDIVAVALFSFMSVIMYVFLITFVLINSKRGVQRIM